MGVEPEGRRRGLGAAMLDAVLEGEAGRGQREMVLECFEENHPAIALYKSRGFEVTQRLYGYAGGDLPPAGPDAPEVVDPVEVAAAMMAHGGPRLSWQTSAPALVHYASPDVAYRLGPARALVSPAGDDGLILRAIVVEAGSRRQGHATRLLSALSALYPGRAWKVVQVCPEAVGREFFERRGFERDPLNQVEMIRPLGGGQSSSGG
jgi:ribosomal protein S18 acetylase RimI-like enzyme